MHLLQAIITAAGESDCENLESGTLLQPFNALTSLGYTAVGLAIVAWAGRARGTERANRHIVGWLLVATGIGSFTFHGFDGAAWQFLHDSTFLTTIWALAVINVAAFRRWQRGLSWMVTAVGASLFTIALLVGPTITNVLTVAVTASLVVADVLAHRSSRINPWIWGSSLAVMAVAVLFFVLGRTNGPLCDPDAIFQGHGIWHLLSGVSLALYFIATSHARAAEQE